MNFALSDEQEFLQDAARGALGRVKTVEAAREALDGAALPDLWPLAVEAGWPGLLVSEERGGAGLGAMEAMLVFAELGRVLAAVPLLGHLPATLLLDGTDEAEALASRRAARRVRGRRAPPTWTTDPREGLRRAPAPVLDGGTLTGEVAWVPDAPGADLLVVVCSDGRVRGDRGRRGGGRAALRRHALARPRALRRRAGDRARGRRRGGRLAHGAGADRRRVARSGRGRARDARSPTPRSASRSAARSAPTRRSSTSWWRSCGGSRTRARSCTTRAGPPRTSRTSCRWPRPPSAPSRARRSTTPRARRSPSTAASARPGSTTRRCTSAARSSRAACSAARPARRRRVADELFREAAAAA